MLNLATAQCAPCRKDEPHLTKSEVADFMFHVPKWKLVAQDDILRLRRRFEFKNFAEAMEFANKLAVSADEQDHHPLLIIEWGSVTMQWWTHTVKGLCRNDFIMAAKTDEIFG
jgi:4a-hydroxytetrahydrobiopterin dehydratase